MRIDSVTYSFSQSELAALLALVKCRQIPFYSGAAVDPREGLISLEKSLLVSTQDDQAAVDRVCAFLALRIGDSTQCLCVDGGATRRYCGLFCAPDVSIVLSLVRGRWRITPFQEQDEAVAHFWEMAGNPTGAQIYMKNETGLWHLEGEAQKSVLRTAAAWLCDGTEPTGEEGTQWKR